MYGTVVEFVVGDYVLYKPFNSDPVKYLSSGEMKMHEMYLGQIIERDSFVGTNVFTVVWHSLGRDSDGNFFHSTNTHAETTLIFMFPQKVGERLSDV